MTCPPVEDYANPRAIGELAQPLRDIVNTIVIETGGRVWLNSGRRSDWQQFQLRAGRVGVSRVCNSAYPGNPTTARPKCCGGEGSHHLNTDSEHCAADMAGDLAWLHRNAARYGIAFTVRNEDWHIEPFGRPTKPLIPFGHTSPPDPNAGRKWKQINPDDTDDAIYFFGGWYKEVSELQLRLAAFALNVRKPSIDPGPMDGDYGPRSMKAVTNFKNWQRGAQVATGQPVWAPSDPATEAVGSQTIKMLRYWTP